jgi:AMP-polyphosphate phosphotransferase
MFESAELGHSIDKERYEREEPELRRALLNAQHELVKTAGFPVVILIAGVDGAGKGETLNLLNEWMDPRHLQTNAMRPVVDGLDDRPPMWRFWRVLPPKGRVGVFVGSWYTQPLLRRVHGEIKRAKLDQALDDIIRFEQMLTDEGALVLKFWLHLSRKRQRKRFEELESDKRTSWRVTATDWDHLAKYDRFQSAAEQILRRTSSAAAPWLVVEGSDERYRSLTIGRTILTALRERLDQPEPAASAPAPALRAPIDGVSVIDRLELDQEMSKDDYRDELARLQGRLNRLSRRKRFERISVVAAFEGVDAAGKGGAIRRVTGALDARRYIVTPIAAPSEEEKARPYLWRFWRNLPTRGRIAIFDRSWYGRVLVERVEGLCTPADWTRAYGEINDFETQLVKNDTILVKYWLQVSPEEQLRRFKEREETAHKQYKITDEDWRNREKWDAYRVAVNDMIDRTSTAAAPWTLVEANNKYFARLKVLRTLADAIEAAL